MYGTKYSEAYYCYPRRFNINLNDEIKAHMAVLHVGKDFDIVAWLTFQEIITESSRYDKTTSKYRVSLCANFLCQSFYFDNINSSHTWTVSDIHAKVIELITLLMPVDSFRVKPKKPHVRNPTDIAGLYLDLPHIASSKKSSSLDIEKLKLDLINTSSQEPLVNQKCYHRLNSFEVVKQDLVDEEKSEAQIQIDKKLAEIFEANPDKLDLECVLCFDSMPNFGQCTILTSCAKAICNECMRSYVESSLLNMLNTAGRLQCAGCDQDMELALIINTATNGQLMDNFMRLAVERVTFVLNEYKWCPAPACGQIIQVDLHSNPYGSVSCACGFKMCLKCNNAPHFPAKCSQIANYYKDLRVNNDFDEPEEKVYRSVGRRCPTCNVFAEKNGGCNHMFCTQCKSYYCWGCGKKWETHQNGACMNFNVDTGVTLEFRKERNPKRKQKNPRYDSSVYHRGKRALKERAELAKNARRVLNSIKLSSLAVSLDDECKQFYSATELVVHENKLRIEKKEEIKEFLSNMVSFVCELHFLCEHAYILVQDHGIDKQKRQTILTIIKSIEITIWLMENSLQQGEGLDSIQPLRDYYDRGVRCMKRLRSLNQELATDS